MIVLSLFFFMCLTGSASPLIVGSNSTVSSQGLITFPNTDTNNTILGYAYMGNGFALQDNTTSCTFDSFMPVSGPLNLNGGRLILQEDLLCTNTFACQSGGRFYGNNHAIEFPKNPADFTIPGFATSTSPLNWTQITSINMFAGVQSVDWSVNNNYVAASSASAASNQEVKIYYFDGATLTTTQSVEMGNIITYSVRWHPTLYYLAIGRSSGLGNELYVYKLNISNGTFTLTDSRNFTNVVPSVSWHPSGNYLIAGTNATGTAHIFSYSFDTATGLLTNGPTLTLASSGALVMQRDSIDFAPGGNRFTVGVGGTTNGTPELYVCSFSALSLSVTASYYQSGLTFASCDWRSTGTYIACGMNGGSENLQIFRHSLTPSESVVPITSSFVGEAANVTDTDWCYGGDYVTEAVSNGVSSLVNIYYFNATSEVLTRVVSVPSATGANTTRWSSDCRYIAYGNDGNQVVILGITPGSSLPLYFDTTTLALNSDLIINTPAYFINNCRIDGRGQRLTIGSGASLTVRPNSQLILDQVEIQGIKNNYLGCMVDSGSLILRNCIISLDSDFTFSRGSIFFDESVIMTGTSKFIYSSRFGSTIGSQSVLLMSKNTTFSYDPTAARRNLLSMQDETSTLFLDGCTLVSTRTGLFLDTGILVLDNRVTLSSGGKNSAEAMQLGTDLGVKVLGSAQVDLFGQIKVL